MGQKVSGSWNIIAFSQPPESRDGAAEGPEGPFDACFRPVCYRVLSCCAWHSTTAQCFVGLSFGDGFPLAPREKGGDASSLR